MVTSFTHTGPGTAAVTWRSDPRWSSIAPLAFGEDSFSRLVVVAAHPDDESLGAGGLVATAARSGVDIDLVVLTDGEHSHPHSPTTSVVELAELRRQEMAQAARALAPGARLTSWDVGDGRVGEHEHEVVRRLVELLGDARSSLVVAPCRDDGHPDHEAAGRAAATAAVRTGAVFLEYPVWSWHWAVPEHTDWERLRVLALDDEARQRKQAAIAAHVSQVRPLSPAPGDEVLLGPGLLAHFEGPEEVYVLATPTDGELDRLQRDDEDPWGVDRRWYEQRKREVTLAALPAWRYRRALELGCSRGALAMDLAARCEELVAVDSSSAAVRAASSRLEALEHVRVEQADLPRDWPTGEFDLVVVSEVGYFLSPSSLDGLRDRIIRSLTPDGTVVLCHWRHEVDGWVLDGPAVHATLRSALLAAGLEELVRHVERDFELLVLGAPEQMPDPAA